MLLPVLFMAIVVFLGAVMFRIINSRTSKRIYMQLSTYFFGITVLLVIVMAIIGFIL